MKLEYVKWFDACSMLTSEWMEASELDETGLEVCDTVGWTAREDDDCLVLVQSKHNPTSTEDDTRVAGVMVVPKKLVIHRVELTLGAKGLPFGKGLVQTSDFSWENSDG